MATFGQPPFLKRRVAWFIFGSIAVGLVAPVVTLTLLGRVPMWAYITAVAIPGVLSGAIGGWFGVAVKREFQAASRVGGRRCWNCGYVLEGLGEAGTCPECGKAYDLPGLRARWGLDRDGIRARR